MGYQGFYLHFPASDTPQGLISFTTWAAIRSRSLSSNGGTPYILVETEALKVQPIYFDLVTHCIVVSDPKGIVARIIASTKVLLRKVGARRVRRNNTWEWQTNRFLGGIGL